jgi:anti-sigma regulatory factor (Ser/Thr protein kinase)
LRTGAITLSIESQFGNVFLIGLAINKIASSIPVNEQSALEMELIVVEAVNNAVEHGHQHRRSKQVMVQVRLESDFIGFTVIDRGAPINFEKALAAASGMENAPDIERGRGLGIIRALTDEIRYERKREANYITLIKYLKHYRCP